MQRTTHVIVVIDVFRAFTTAAHVLASKPASYRLATHCDVITRLAVNAAQPISIGKPEKGSQRLYEIPNSPARAGELELAGVDVLHRTEAGARGVLMAARADLVLAAGFANASATVAAIQGVPNPRVELWAMGHEAARPSLEDDLCAEMIQAFLEGKGFELGPHRAQLREGAGRYFFTEDQQQYPEADFDLCLERDRFDFAIQAVVQGDHAVLTQLPVSSKVSSLPSAPPLDPGFPALAISMHRGGSWLASATENVSTCV